VSGLGCSGGLSSNNLCDDGMLRMSRELQRSARRGNGASRKILKDSGYSRLANTSLGGNFVERETIGGKRNDVFLLSRGDRTHDETVEYWRKLAGYID
jgi:hypothetical protein